MMGVRICGGISLFALFLVNLGLGTPSRAIPPQTAPASTVLGAGSCSATACHGESRPAASKVLRNEYITWIKRDRHADAFSVLSEDRSRSISNHLGDQIPADQDARCLACHATQNREPVLKQAPAAVREGVGCESCHGPADRWIGPHTRFDWSARSPVEKERFGMIPTGDLTRRAQVCAGCHVGEPARDGRPAREVNHEMIAAGHPRLNFEFSAYLATMTHHWRDDIGPDATADFPARAWSIGQLTSARSALVLLRDRAERTRPSPIRRRAADWPELSESACYSCHHDLRDETWRRRNPNLKSAARWSPWTFANFEGLAPVATDAQALAELRQLMDEPRPDPVRVIRLTHQISADLDRRLKDVSDRRYDANQVEAILKIVQATPAESWEQATQRYLALVPLHQALNALAPARNDPGSAEELKRLRDSLRFPEGSDSPRSFDPLLDRKRDP